MALKPPALKSPEVSTIKNGVKQDSTLETKGEAHVYGVWFEASVLLVVGSVVYYPQPTLPHTHTHTQPPTHTHSPPTHTPPHTPQWVHKPGLSLHRTCFHAQSLCVHRTRFPPTHASPIWIKKECIYRGAMHFSNFYLQLSVINAYWCFQRCPFKNISGCCLKGWSKIISAYVNTSKTF